MVQYSDNEKNTDTGIDVKPTVSELESLARIIRGQVVSISHKCRVSHLGSCLSCIDILVAAYWHALHIDPGSPHDPGRDRFLLSKGHAAAALFCTLSRRGFFPEAWLDSFAQAGCCLEEHPGPACAPGVEAATGSLGHGLSLGLGMALAGRLQGRHYRTMVLLSDGECNEGSVWEAAMFAAGQKLDRLWALVDFNKWQATGRSCETMALDPLADKFSAFGFRVLEIDGHNMSQLQETLSLGPDEQKRPTAVIAHTVKGKGVSFMEDDNNWHYCIPTAEQVRQAHYELGLA